MRKKVIVISGPTASGKSAVAEWLLTKFASLNQIINADSMQIYKELPLLTAVPELKDYHSLYAVKNYDQHYSMGVWFDEVTKIINGSAEEAFIVVGGTGLYIKGLIQGISSMPDVPIELRKKLQQELDDIGINSFYKYLCSIDPGIENRIKPTDRQRMVRAAEIFLHTGKSIRSFDHTKNQAPYDFLHITLDPERKYLYNRCEERFDYFVKNGALEEVKAFSEKTKGKRSGYMLENALGYGELLSFLMGDISLEEAIIKAKQKTRNYAKRQLTWFRGQGEAKKLQYDCFSEALFSEVERQVTQFLKA